MDIIPTAQWGYDFVEDEGTFEYADGYNLNVTGVIIVKKGESFYGMGNPANLYDQQRNLVRSFFSLFQCSIYLQNRAFLEMISRTESGIYCQELPGEVPGLG